MSDHVHMLASIPRRLSVGSSMGYLKGKSAFMVFDKRVNLKYKFWDWHFWAKGYHVSTIGLNEARIKKDVQNREEHAIALDKIRVKAYEAPVRDPQSSLKGE